MLFDMSESLSMAVLLASGALMLPFPPRWSAYWMWNADLFSSWSPFADVLGFTQVQHNILPLDIREVQCIECLSVPQSLRNPGPAMVGDVGTVPLIPVGAAVQVLAALLAD